MTEHHDALDPVRNDPGYKAWAARQADQTAPALRNSTVAITIVPAELDIDIDYAVQLGLMIMMDKPILVVVPEGREIPPKLKAVADVIIVGEVTDADFQDQLNAALDKLGIEMSDGDEG